MTQTEFQGDVPRISRGSRVPSSPAVSIIILATTGIQRIQRCLASIAAMSEDGPAAEIIVLANGTPRDVLGPLTSRDDIVVVRSNVNHGFGGGCNWAVRFAQGERLVFVNDDAAVTRGWLRALNATMDGDTRIGVVGSRILRSDGRLQEVGDVIWSDGSTSHVGRGLPGATVAKLGHRDVDYVSFCSAMVRRKTWDEVGGFDERYFPAYYEDADLCMAARARGWRVVCEPASVVVHEEGGSTEVRFRHFLARRNQQLFADKWKATLAGHDHRPARVVPRALLARSSRPPTAIPDSGEDVVRPPRGSRSVVRVDEVEALSVELRHLAADVALKGEYISFLGSELDSYGATDLLHGRYRALRGALGRLVRRNHRLNGAVEGLKARIGERASQ
jgi:GT2 family glycosyltransferase